MRTSYKTKRNSKSLKRIKKNRSKRRYRKSHGGALGNSPFPTDAQPSKKMPTTYQSMSFDELRESYEKLLKKNKELLGATQQINHDLDDIMRDSEYKDVSKNIKKNIVNIKNISNIHIEHGYNSEFDRNELVKQCIVGKKPESESE